MAVSVWLVTVAAGLAAEPSTYRFLIAVDVSFSNAKVSQAMRETVSQLIGSGFGGQIRDGEGYGVWTYGDRVQRITMQSWNADTMGYDRAVIDSSLSRIKPKGLADFRGLLQQVAPLARTNQVFTLVVVSDGEDSISGTPFDPRINGIFADRGRVMRRDKRTFVISLLAENASWVRGKVSESGGDIELPVPSVGPLAENRPAAPVPAVVNPPPPPQVAVAPVRVTEPVAKAAEAVRKVPGGVAPVVVKPAPEPPSEKPVETAALTVPARTVPPPVPPVTPPTEARPATVAPAAEVKIQPPQAEPEGRSVTLDKDAKGSVEASAKGGAEPIISQVAATPSAASTAIEEHSSDSASGGGRKTPSTAQVSGTSETNAPAQEVVPSGVSQAMIELAPHETGSRGMIVSGFVILASLVVLLAVWFFRSRVHASGHASLISQSMERGGDASRTKKP